MKKGKMNKKGWAIQFIWPLTIIVLLITVICYDFNMNIGYSNDLSIAIADFDIPHGFAVNDDENVTIITPTEKPQEEYELVVIETEETKRIYKLSKYVFKVRQKYYNESGSDALFRKVAKEFKYYSTEDKIYMSYEFALISLTYAPAYYNNGLIDAWNEKMGDCTEQSLLTSKLLTHNNIKNRVVHGYNYMGKHDYVEIRLDDEWINLEAWFYNDDREYELKGMGVW